MREQDRRQRTGRQGQRALAWLAAGVVGPMVLIALGVWAPAFGLLSVLTAVYVLLWRLRAHAAPLLLVFMTVALVGTVVERPWLNMSASDVTTDDGAARATAWAAGGRFDERLPVVLHLVFDELMSPGAIDPALPGGGAAIAGMRQLAEARGLRLYESIYSRYYYSAVSIPNMMNAEYLGRSGAAEVSRTIAHPAADNAYFADMAAKGYRTAVFQTAVLDFCLPASVTLCETFPSYDPGAASSGGVDERTRSVYLWDALLRAYEPGYVPAFGRWLIRRIYGIDQRELGVLGAADRFDVQAFPGWFDRFRAFVTRVPRGSHVFAHFLVPHSPYLLTEGCVVSGEFDSGYALTERITEPAAREGARRVYYEQYLNQVRCVVSRIDALLEEIDAIPALADALIVIHGDHGSRISAGRHAEDVGPRDLIDNYASFFAVRRPGLEAGIDCTFTSLPQIFRETLHPVVNGVRDPPLPVLVAGRAGDDVRVSVPMPVFGCASTGGTMP